MIGRFALGANGGETEPLAPCPLRTTRHGDGPSRTPSRIRITPIANFIARIVSDLLLDDGIEKKRKFGIEAEFDGTRVALVLSAAEFGRMGWVLRHLGPRAIICPGQQQHARAALQWLSSRAQQERILKHPGGRRVGAQGLRAIYKFDCRTP